MRTETKHVPAFEAVRAAASRIADQIRRTPVLSSAEADRRAGARLFFKCENFQRTGSFKFRGALNAVRALRAQERRAGVITFSSGNHGQAIARACQIEGVKAVVVMPKDAPLAKVQAARSFGAQIVHYDRLREDREALAKTLLEREGYCLIPPFDHPMVIAGQGTSAMELIEEVGQLDALYVCLGGGGLLSGCALAASALSPACRIIGVEPEAGNDVQQAFARGEPVTIEVPDTIADGARTTCVGDITFAIIRQHCRSIETVSDNELIETMRFFAQWMKIVIEPTGCLAAAAAMRQREFEPDAKVGVILSGGNVDLAHYGAWLAAA
jgi:threonine dehydratase